MEIGIYLQFIILFLLLLMSAYFSGTETAFFSLSRLEIESLKKKDSPYLIRILVIILSSLDDVLITILIGNMVVNVFASTLGEKLAADLFQDQNSEVLSILLMTILLLIFGELTPKRLAVRYSRKFSSLSAIPLYFTHRFFTPVRFVLKVISKSALAVFPGEKEKVKEDNGDIILSTVKLGYKQEMISNYELQLFKSFFKFKKMEAGDLMIPRSLLNGIHITMKIPELLRKIENGTTAFDSFIPVYKNNIDHLVGYVLFKDLLSYKYGKRDGDNISLILRQFHIVPHSKDLNELVDEMRKTGSIISLLVDEYGGTAGIITFKRIVEYLLNSIESNDRIIPVSGSIGKYIVPGLLSIENLSNLLDKPFSLEEKTTAGLFLKVFGNIPEKGDCIIYQNIKWTIKEMDGYKIISLIVEIL